MFIYETRKIFDENGNGPFKGIVFSSEVNTPAAVGDTVIFVKSTDDEVLVVDDFIVGEEE